MDFGLGKGGLGRPRRTPRSLSAKARTPGRPPTDSGPARRPGPLSTARDFWSRSLCAGQFPGGAARGLRAALVACGAAGLTGCNLDWEKPDLSLPPPERFQEAKPRSAPPIGAAHDFSRRFGSRELVDFVDRALENNNDIAAAVARLHEADAQARVSSSPLWPSLSSQNLFQQTRVAGTETNMAPNYNPLQRFYQAAGQKQIANALQDQTTFSGVRTNLWRLELTASYTIDFWGQNEDASKAARLLANASRFDRNVVEMTTIASVLSTYFIVLNAQDLLRIAHDNVHIATEVLNAIKFRLEVGTATLFDVALQETVVDTQRAAIPVLEETLRQQRNLLAVLLGQTPESLHTTGSSLKALRFPQIEPGLPSEVLLRRPDVAEAEAKLASQEFSVLQARAAFFPTFTLTGPYYGVQSIVTKYLMQPEAIAWQLVGSVAQPIFDGYNLQGQYMLQQSKFSELAANYRKQILTALSDTENAMIAITETGKELKIEEEGVDAARRALDAAKARLREGTIDIVTLST
ncbi:MAG TPA: efflux transporter outer membrane subunit, partial [Methylocystis sp.]|nr:efflux transporter outer membrane subunit [Methylocystis sp.]